MTPNDEKDDSPKPVAIGIDFGTSKCCVAAVRDGRVHVLENEFGQRTTPSWVAFNSQQRLVGAAALDQAVVNCANTVSAVKMTLGKTYDKVKDLPSARKIEKRYSNNSPQYCVNYKKRRECLSPEQIAAMLLTKMKVMAETSLGCSVDKAVISVPACYGNAQRAALMNAAKVAGLDVQQLINETTAAGIAFEDNRRVKTPTTIAVVDFGAGKLDLSIMEVEEKSITVIAATGSPSHGGCNLDDFLVKHSVPYIQQKYGKDVNISDKAHVKLRLACEKAKKTLSLLTEAQICTDSLIDDRDVKIPVRRQDISIFLEETKKTIVGNFERLFKGKSIRKDTIDRVVLVGGSTRIPAIMSILEEYFGPHKLDQTVNQDEAVAQGAALRAAALSGAVAGIEVYDVSSYDICYSNAKLNDHKFIKILDKFSSFSSIISQKFNEARRAKWRVFERVYYDGSKCDIDLCSVEFTISYLWPGNFVNGELLLHLNESGMFSISSALSNESKVNIVPVQFASSHSISTWTKEETKFRSETEAELKRVDAEVELESLCFGVQAALGQLEMLENFVPSEFTNAVENTTSWMAKNIESTQISDIEKKIAKMNNVNGEILRLLETAQKKAVAKEEAAKKLAEMELLNQLIFDTNSVIIALKYELTDSKVARDFYEDKLLQCDSAVSSVETWAKNSESASPEEVSKKLKDLTHFRNEVDQLRADVAREKERLDKEEAAAQRKEMELRNEAASIFASLLPDLQCAIRDESLVLYADQQMLQSWESTLRSLVSYERNIERSSVALWREKCNKLIQLKAEVYQFKKDARKKALLEEQTAKKLEDMRFHEEQISEFDALLSEVSHALGDPEVSPHLDTDSYRFYEDRVKSLTVRRANIERPTTVCVRKELQDLIHMKNTVDHLKTQAELGKTHREELDHNAMLVNYSSVNSNSFNNNFDSIEQKISNDLPLAKGWNEQIESNNEWSLASRNSSSGSVAYPSYGNTSTHAYSGKARSQSVTRRGTGGKEDFSRSRSRPPSMDKTNEPRFQFGQSLEKFLPDSPSSEKMNEVSSVPQSRRNSRDVSSRRSRSRNESVDQNGVHRSSQCMGGHNVGRFVNPHDLVEDRERTARNQKRSESGIQSKIYYSKHRSRTPENAEKREQRSRRARSSSGVRRSSNSSKDRHDTELRPSLKDEQHRKLKTPLVPFVAMPDRGLHPQQSSLTDGCTSQQQLLAPSKGNSLVQMRQSAVGCNGTLPSKLSPPSDFKETNSFRRKLSESKAKTLSETIPTDTALLEKSRDHNCSSNDATSKFEEVNQLIWKFESLGILLPMLQMMEKTTNNVFNCDRCMSYNHICPNHRSEGLEAFGRTLNPLPGLLAKIMSDGRKIDVERQTSLDSAENIATTKRSNTPDMYAHNPGISNDGYIGRVENSTTSMSESITVSAIDTAVDRRSSTEGPARVNMSYSPVYQRAALRGAYTAGCAADSVDQSQFGAASKVREITAKYEHLGSK